MMILADKVFQMSNFDDFDNDQISWKLAQSKPFVFPFDSNFFFFLGKNAKWSTQ